MLQDVKHQHLTLLAKEALSRVLTTEPASLTPDPLDHIFIIAIQEAHAWKLLHAEA